MDGGDHVSQRLSWCYLIALVIGAYYVQFPFLKPDTAGHIHPVITMVHVNGGLALGYIVLVPGFLFAGFFIWVDSMIQAYQRRDFASIGTAAWNTFAQIHNTYGAMKGMPEAFKSVGKAFGKIATATARAR
jgi:uncharacterized membrane protein (DUF485 family)